MNIVLVMFGVVIIVLLLLLLVRKPVARIDTSRLEERLIRVEGELDKLAPKIEGEFRENRKEISDNLQGIQRTVDNRVKSLQDDNSKKLEEMRQTVDEKLQKSVEQRFNESFKAISGQLTQVYQGLGEMRNLAHGVGDLKKVMEGVKTRGIYGEVQLGNIISDCLSPDQYQENVITKTGSSDRVEFAIKMPGREEEVVFLPIDSKFPVENYARLIDASREILLTSTMPSFTSVTSDSNSRFTSSLCVLDTRIFGPFGVFLVFLSLNSFKFLEQLLTR